MSKVYQLRSRPHVTRDERRQCYVGLGCIVRVAGGEALKKLQELRGDDLDDERALDYAALGFVLAGRATQAGRAKLEAALAWAWREAEEWKL